MRRALATIAATAAVALVAGCSSSGGAGESPSSNPSVVDGITIPPIYQPPSATVVAGPSACPAEFATALNTAARHGSFTLRSQHTSHLLICSYQNRQATPADCSTATIRVNTEPQAFMAFDRWNVETGQNSMWGNNPKLQPVPVPGIGILAEWAPALRELGAANDTTWVSVVLACPGSPQSVPPLAKTLANSGLASSG